MKHPELARAAVRRAEAEAGDIERSLWLAKAADHAIDATAVLVGGAAANLYTGVYSPTDVDMCAYLDESDRASLMSIGFRQIQGDHFEYVFADGERWLLEFPSSTVDGSTSEVVLETGEVLRVISLESLMVDRILQSTDGTSVTFDEATRLAVATFEEVDWAVVESDIRAKAVDLPEIKERCKAVIDRATELLSQTS